MPAPGAQHNTIIANPFAEEKHVVSQYTAQEIATLQSRLERQLGPEYISSRAGPSGQKVHYLAAEKCIQLANEVFGFNGWSSSIRELQVDFVDENPTSGKVSLGLSVIVRVTLRDGTFHEDIGYGHMENCKGKAAAFEKAKKEGTTDGLKRALRNFGNVLGNCIYDKEYLAKVTKVKAAPSSKWDVEELHRHSTYASIKKENEPPVPEKSLNSVPAMPNGDSVDEFGDFDAADFSSSHDQDSHPDEVILPATSEHFNDIRGNGAPQRNVNSMGNQSNKAKAQNMPALARPNDGLQASSVSNKSTNPQQPQTPNGGFSRSTSGAGNNMQVRTAQETTEIAPRKREPQKYFAVRVGKVPGIYDTWGEANQQTAGIPGGEWKAFGSRQGADAYLAERENADATNALHHVTPQTAASRNLNQSTRSNPPSHHASPVKQEAGPSEPQGGRPSFALPPGAEAPGFFSARAAERLPQNPEDIASLPVADLRFDPKAESPSIRKTPGVDHHKSRPLTRDLKHVPGSTQSTSAPPTRANVTNPHLDATRRIGVPGSPSPMGNRSGFKPPMALKRANDGGGMRPPLSDKPANGTIHVDGGDVKRQRISGP